jgi:hypothetical protein
MPEQVTFIWEYTDTFGGEANYAWCRRGEVQIPAAITGRSNAHAARIIKRAAGLNGARGRSYWHGSDSYEFRPYRCCTVLFANFTDAPSTVDDGGAD